MKNQLGWGWKIYALIFTFAITGNLISIVSPDSFLYIYYHILIAFDQNYKLLYRLSVLSALLNMLSLFPLYFFIFRRYFFIPRLWQILFVFRIILDIVGHSYELKSLKSFFVTDFAVGILATIPIIILLFPSYIAGYEYAFRQKKA